MYNRIYLLLKNSQKGECIYILNKKLKYYTKEVLRFTNIIVVGMLVITAIVFLKYKPVYKVTLAGEDLGYIANKEEFEKIIEENIINKQGENIAFVTLDEEPKYELAFVNNNEETSEENIFASIEIASTTTYTSYAITLNGENKEYVANKEEAEQLVEEMKTEYSEDLDFEIGIVQVYTENPEEWVIENIEIAEVNINNELEEELEEKIKIEESTVNGILLDSQPVTGIISSRYGDREERSSGHGGLDIAAPSGTPIYACGDGTVIQAGVYGGYGNLVIIDHGNGVQTYYGHCSKLYVTKGETVSSGENIAAVGSTGDSTGPHLHLEIRINGSRINPQQYFYKNK